MGVHETRGEEGMKKIQDLWELEAEDVIKIEWTEAGESKSVVFIVDHLEFEDENLLVRKPRTREFVASYIPEWWIVELREVYGDIPMPVEDSLYSNPRTEFKIRYENYTGVWIVDAIYILNKKEIMMEML